jgi:hypothetical protein
MIAKEQVQALRKAGLANVCELNGELMKSDFTPLSATELKKAQDILSSTPSQPKAKTTKKK